MKRFQKLALFGALAFAGADALSVLYAGEPMEMPAPLDHFIRWGLTKTGHTEWANPDDIEVIAAILVFVLFLPIVAVLLWLVNKGLQRLR